MSNDSQNTNEKGMLDSARNVAEQKVNQAIDQFAGKIPGGEQYKQQAKDAAEGVLLNLEKEGENRINGMGGPQGIFNKILSFFRKK